MYKPIITEWEVEVVKDFAPKFLHSVLCCAVLSHSVMSDSATLWTVASQAPLSMDFLQARIMEWIATSSFTLLYVKLK